MEQKFTSVKISNKLHDKIAELQKLTGVPQARLFEMAWETFERSSKLEQLMLFCKDDTDDDSTIES